MQGINPSYTNLFQTHTLYQGGGGLSGTPTPTISSTLSDPNSKFCRVLEIPFKVSETLNLINNLLFGYHANCSMCIFNNCPNVSEKQLSNASRNNKFQSVKNKTLCNNSSILSLFRKVIFKWVGVPNFGETV